MTVVNIDVSNVASSFHEDDKVIFYAPAHRSAADGGVTNTAPETVPLESGKASVDLKPGPVSVRLQCRGIADTSEKQGTVPDAGPVTLDDVLAGSFTYTPAVVNSALERITTARDAALGDVDGAVADALAPASVYTGIGSPEGQVAASVGAVYTDTAATAGAVRWIKASGAGSTGWKVQWGDTGWRDITGALPGYLGGGLKISRDDATVHLRFDDLLIDGTSARVQFAFFLPSGFVTPSVTNFSLSQQDDGHASGPVRINPNGTLEIYGALGKSMIRGTISYRSDGSWPVTLPGTPA